MPSLEDVFLQINAKDRSVLFGDLRHISNFSKYQSLDAKIYRQFKQGENNNR